MTVDSLEQAYAHCRKVTEYHGKTFSFALRFLPREKREAIYAVYGFCRYADDLIDEAPEGMTKETVLAAVERWRADISAVYAGERIDHPVMIAWADMLTRYPVNQTHALELIEGVSMDLAQTRYQSYEELKVYCHKVAGVVGLMLIEIFGYPGQDKSVVQDFADSLGLAMQLTNIIRDVGEDARKDRIYLPLEELEQFDYSEEDLLAGRVNANFIRLMKFQIQRARDEYITAFRIIPTLNRDSQLCVKLMGALYSEILTMVEHNRYNVFERRAIVSYLRKVLKVPRLYFFPLVEPSRAF